MPKLLYLARFANELTCDVNVKIYSGYFWCKSCDAKCIPVLALKNAIFYSGHRIGYLFQTKNIVKSRDIDV